MMIFSRFMAIVALGFLAACSTAPVKQTSLISSDKENFSSERNMGVTSSPRVVAQGDVPKGGGRYHIGKSYTVAGRTYTPFEKQAGFSESGMASWYGKQFHGRKTANGEIFDMHGMSAAHKTMPLPSYARVTNASNGRSIVVRVNDRGPFAHNRAIDLSSRAADLLDFKKSGHIKVKIDYMGPAPLKGSQDARLEASLRQGAPAELPAQSSIMVASNSPVTFNKLALQKQKIPEILRPLPPQIEEEPKQLEVKSPERTTIASVISRLKPTPLDDDQPKTFSLRPGSLY